MMPWDKGVTVRGLKTCGGAFWDVAGLVQKSFWGGARPNNGSVELSGSHGQDGR